MGRVPNNRRVCPVRQHRQRALRLSGSIWGPLLGVVSAVPGMVPVTVPGAGLFMPVARAEVTAVVGSVEVMGAPTATPDGEKKSGRAPVKAANPSR